MAPTLRNVIPAQRLALILAQPVADRMRKLRMLRYLAL